MKWRKLVGEQGRSGQSVVEVCRERRLCAPYFYAWKKRLREADAGQGVVRAVYTGTGTDSWCGTREEKVPFLLPAHGVILILIKR